MAHHLIFEGAELSGKSWLMSQIYNYLEPKYNQSGFVLDGCHWFNCDIGIYGTEHGQPVNNKFLDIFEKLANKNILVEKFLLSDAIYNKLHRNIEINYSDEIKKLKTLNFKIILVTMPEDKNIIEKRLVDRLNLYPHYKDIMHDPEWYINQQKEYLNIIERSGLDHLIVKTEKLPDDTLTKKILSWLGEQ